MHDYNKKYEYINSLKNCPNCGADLSATDKECPACSINLLGYNEHDNRVLNIESQAEKIEEIVEQKQELLDKYAEDMIKKKKAKKIVSIILSAFAFIIIAVIVLANNEDGLKELGNSSRYQSYEQVIASFKKEDMTYEKTVGPFNVEHQKLQQQKGDMSELYTGKQVSGFTQYLNIDDDNNFRTSFAHTYSNGTTQYTFHFDFDSEEVYIPDTTLDDNKIVFEGNKIPLDFEYEFNEVDETTVHDKELSVIDNFIIEEYVREKKNIIEKYGGINIDITTNSYVTNSLKFDAYIRENPRDSFTPYQIILVTPLNDNLLYSIEISATNIEYIYNILNYPEKYLSLRLHASNIAMLD